MWIKYSFENTSERFLFFSLYHYAEEQEIMGKKYTAYLNKFLYILNMIILEDKGRCYFKDAIDFLQ